MELQGEGSGGTELDLYGDSALRPAANTETTHDQDTPQIQTEPLGRHHFTQLSPWPGTVMSMLC